MSGDIVKQTGSIFDANSSGGPVGNNASAGSGTLTPVGSLGFQVFNIKNQTGNITLGAPSGQPLDGNQIRVRVWVDATGGYTFSFNAIYDIGTDVLTNMIPSAANSYFMMLFEYVAASAKWRYESIVRGYTV